MRRICLTLPTNRPCAGALTAVGAEAAYAARHFDVEVCLLVLDSADAPARAEHRAAALALPPVPGVTVHHLDEAEQRAFLREVIARSGVAEPERVLALMLPSEVSYGACTNRAFLLAAALGCTSVHRRDSDSDYRTRDGEPVFPVHAELEFLGRRAADVAGRASRTRLDAACADRRVALVGGSFTGEMSVDLAEMRRLDPAVYEEVVGLSIPANCPPPWRANAIGEAFRGAGDAPFTGDRTTLTRVSPTRVDMCNIAFDHAVYGRVPLPPATDTIGSDYFLIQLVHDARLPGVEHNRHIVNHITGERRTDAGFLAYQRRFVKFLLSKGGYHAVQAATAKAGDALLDDAGRLRPSAVAALVRDAAGAGRDENTERLAVVDRAYGKLGGRYATVAQMLAGQGVRLLAEAERDLADFAALIDAWGPLVRAAEDTPAGGVGAPASSARTVTVRYAGGVARRGPLTLGQANMIRCMLRDDPAYINIHAVWPVPEGVATRAVIDAFRTLVVRHEALRTTFPHGPDAAPREQVVAAEGRFAVTVVDHAEPPPEAERYAEAVADRDRVRRFGLAEEFPLRISVLTRRGTPTFVALAASHAATDAGALAVLHEEWRTLLTGTELPPLGAVTPLELAAEEASPAGVRKSDASLGYWERILRTGPQAMFAEPHAVPPEGRQPQLTLRSRRGARALARAATRTGNAPSTVLLTAWCALLAHRAGQSACVIALPTSNRFTRRLTRAVTTVSQDALLHLDVRVPSFDALLRTAFGGVLDAYRHSRFDALRLWEMVERVTDERGSHFARDVVFNDVSALAPAAQDAAPPPEPGAEPEPGPELELCWGPGQELPTRALAFAYATTPLLHLSLWADPALFPRAEAEGFLTGVVRLLEAVAEEDVPLSALGAVTGVRPAERGPQWRRVDGCWVSPPAVADALGRALDGRPVHVTVEEAPDGGAGPRLTAYVAAGGDSLTPERAHAALRDVLPGRPGLLAPHRYVIVQGPPPDGGPGSAWTGRPVLAEGDGRKRQVRHDGR